MKNIYPTIVILFLTFLSVNLVSACITTERTVSTAIDSQINLEEVKIALEQRGFDPTITISNGISILIFVYGTVKGEVYGEIKDRNIVVKIYAKENEPTIFSVDSLEQEYGGEEINPTEQLKTAIKIAILGNFIDFPIGGIDNLEIIQGHWRKQILICETFNNENPDGDCSRFTYKSACDGELKFLMPECLQDYCSICNMSNEYLETNYNKKALGIPSPSCGEELIIKSFMILGNIDEKGKKAPNSSLVYYIIGGIILLAIILYLIFRKKILNSIFFH